MAVAKPLFGVFLLIAGGLAVVNHPIVDRYNRWMKAWGTRNSASDIEMSAWSILFGRIAGSIIALVGLGVLANSLW